MARTPIPKDPEPEPSSTSPQTERTFVLPTMESIVAAIQSQMLSQSPQLPETDNSQTTETTGQTNSNEISDSPKRLDLKPLPGPQKDFFETTADIAIYGGAAGGGKTWALEVEPLRHVQLVQGFGGVIFRRTSNQIRNEGGMWDESFSIYPSCGATPFETTLEWIFPPFENRIRFAHMEHEKNRFDWQGAQIPYIGWDELTHFTEEMFFYMLSRNRSTCGVKPYIRATTNPDADSWVAEFIEWWTPTGRTAGCSRVAFSSKGTLPRIRFVHRISVASAEPEPNPEGRLSEREPAHRSLGPFGRRLAASS